jgi:phospholipid/cholesterol/gamma-HCH transport system substrate-binding protein
METKINYTVVGVFVVALIAAFILCVIWLSSGLSTTRYTPYLVFMEESVTGLNTGSPVKYNGVDVGVVKAIEINHKNLKEVKITLNIKTGTPITKGTIATLNVQGLTGISYISLKGNGDTSPLEILPGEKYPIIQTAPSLFFRLDKAVTELTRNLNTLLRPENQKAIIVSLSNIERITTSLANQSDALEKIIENTEQFTAKFKPLLIHADKTIQAIKIQTLPEANQLLENLNNTSSNLLDTSREVKQNPSIIIRGKSAPPPGPGE